jgi:GNAT superfamily N-acetyltransferase
VTAIEPVAEVPPATPVLIRPARETDFAFIVDAWCRSFEGSPVVHGADRNHYRSEMVRVIRKMLSGVGAATTRVACDREDDDTLLGFAAFTGPELHYVYVRQDFRQMGIAKAMLEGASIAQYTFRTLQGERRMRTRERGWKFTPRFTL